ncbi:MAG TPA: hypothetical protein VF428_11615 [Casimicrobiaceae bacterium]
MRDARPAARRPRHADLAVLGSGLRSDVAGDQKGQPRRSEHEEPYAFTTLEALLEDFQADVIRLTAE